MADVQVVLSGDDAKLYRSFQRIVDQQVKTESGYKKIKEASKQANDEANKHAESMANMGAAIETAATNFVGFVAGFATVQTGAKLVTEAFREQIELQRESFTLSQRVAASQQEAAKNLTGTTDAETRSVLSQRAPIIAAQTGFPDIAKITDAIGAAFSASGDLEKSLSAVAASAELTRLTTEQITTVASGALDVARGSGITDARQNLAFLLSAGKSARIEDPAKLAGTIAPTVSSGVSTVPNQNREQASREIAALFTTLNQQATDKSGDSTRTAVTTLLAKMETFFSGRDTDPGTVAGRLQALQSDPALRGEFFAKPFGEVAFQKGFELVATAGSDLAKSFAQSQEEITFSVDVFNEKVKQLQEATPQLATATAVARTDAAIEAAKFRDTEGATKTAIADIANNALKQTSTGVGSFLSNQFTSLVRGAEQLGGTPESLATTARTQLEARADQLQRIDTPAAREALSVIRAAQDNIRNLVERQTRIAEETKAAAQAIANDGLQQFNPETDSRKQTPLPYGSFDVPGQMSVDAFENRQFYEQSTDRFDFPERERNFVQLPTPEQLSTAEEMQREGFQAFGEQMKRLTKAASDVADQLERAERATKSAGKISTARTAGRP